jgi:hypothetical protein
MSSIKEAIADAIENYLQEECVGAFVSIEKLENQVEGLLEKVRLLTIDVEEMIKINRKIQTDLKLLKEQTKGTEVIK